ncbi:hypothetical protein [Microterricola viridarii]|nr:hypothetical protein [Microterricola viridarii]
MSPSESVALLTAAVAAVIAIGVFIAGQVLTFLASRRERRRLLVVRMIDIIDDLVRRQSIPAMIRNWKNADIELALVQSRLAMDLTKRELVIADWVWGQTQRVFLSTTKSEYVELTMAVSSRLVQWHRGAIGLDWFVEDLRRNPVQPDFRIPNSVGWKRNFGAIGETITLLGLVALVLNGVTRVIF